MSKEEKVYNKKVGGIPFFLSLFFFLFVTPINLAFFIATLNKESIHSWVWFLPGLFLGIFTVKFLIRGQFSVLLHETRHSIVSSFAGNKSKGIKVAKDSGYFEYSYTDETAAYNAFINLAPYCLPLITACAIGAGLLFFRNNHHLFVFFVGCGVGADSVMNFRDIHFAQSDIYLIRGGFFVGLLYIVCANLVVFSLVGIWVSSGIVGFDILISYWFNLVKAWMAARH